MLVATNVPPAHTMLNSSTSMVDKHASARLASGLPPLAHWTANHSFAINPAFHALELTWATPQPTALPTALAHTQNTVPPVSMKPPWSPTQVSVNQQSATMFASDAMVLVHTTARPAPPMLIWLAEPANVQTTPTNPQVLPHL